MLASIAKVRRLADTHEMMWRSAKAIAMIMAELWLAVLRWQRRRLVGARIRHRGCIGDRRFGRRLVDRMRGG